MGFDTRGSMPCYVPYNLLQPSAEMLQTTETEQQIEENSEPFQLTIIIDKVTSEQKKLLQQLLKIS